MDLNMIGIGQDGSSGIWKVWLTDMQNTPSKMVFEIYDLIYIILSFADDESLFKLAYLNQKFNKILLKDQSIRGKSFQIRILNYKL
jgi:hypothetical protein